MVALMVVLMLASMLDGSSGGSTPWGFSNLHYPIVPIHLGAESTLIHAGWGSATSIPRIDSIRPVCVGADDRETGFRNPKWKCPLVVEP